MENKQEYNGSTLTKEEVKEEEKQANVTVVAIGGGGANALNNVVKSNKHNFRTVAMNTDEQALQKTQANQTVLLGKTKTKGNGTKGDPAVGYEAAVEAKKEIRQSLENSDLVFLLAGLGAGTGTGASIVVAEEAKALGATVVAVVTTPFTWEGKTCAKLAQTGIKELSNVVDNLIVLHNNDLKTYLQQRNEQIDLTKAFLGMDSFISENISVFIRLLNIPGIINSELAHIKSILDLGKSTAFGLGEASGENRAVVATENALNNPFLSFDLKESKGVIFTVQGAADFTYDHLDQVSEIISKSVSGDTNLILGAVVVDDMPEGTIKVSVLAVK